MGISLVVLGLLVALVVAAWLLPPDGKVRSPWWQFFGRFHPLLVHLPIGVLLMAPVMEFIGRSQRWPFLRAAAGFLLVAGTLGVFAAAGFGWLLAYSGGYSGDLIRRHMWGGVALAACCWAVMSLRCGYVDRDGRSRLGRRALYVSACAAMLGLLTWTSHQGGSLARGEAYLYERLPVDLQSRLGLLAKPVAHPFPTAFYATHIKPILDDHCVVCHGANKTQGKLRLDTFDLLMAGGENGRVVTAADVAHSELYRRITLPHEDKKFMPAEGKKPLDERQIKLIEQWIKFGASPSETAAEFRTKGAEVPVEEVARLPQAPDYRPKLAQLAALERKLEVRLVPVSQVPTDGLILRTVNDPKAATDQMLADLAPVAEFIVDAELARTKITDPGLRSLATFTNLRRIDLSQTAVTTRGLAALATLPKLEWISLVGSKVDGNAPEVLGKFPALRTSYVNLEEHASP